MGAYTFNMPTLKCYRHAHVSLLASCVSFCEASSDSSGENLSLIKISNVAVFSRKLVQSRGVDPLGSTQADCKGMQSTCRAGTSAHQDVHACWEEASDSHL